MNGTDERAAAVAPLPPVGEGLGERGNGAQNNTLRLNPLPPAPTPALPRWALVSTHLT